jgi:SAM-dependent methyltransferase
MQLVLPKSVVDVGCGIGTWLSIFEKNGVEEILGIDGDYVNRNQLLFDQAKFIPHDLTQPLPKNQFKFFDLAISLEVGEHLPETSAEQFVSTLVSLAPVVLFSAAIPYQGGTYHINEQWQNYWAKLFAKEGYVTVDYLKSHIWGDAEVEYYYSQNSLLYIDKTHLERFPQLKTFVVSPDNKVLSRVHPLKWIEAHNPPPQSLRSLLKAFPISLKHTLRYHINRFSIKTN